MDRHLDFVDRLTVNVPPELRDAVRCAARQRGVTQADYIRRALGDRLARDGRAVDHLPLVIGHLLGRAQGRIR